MRGHYHCLFWPIICGAQDLLKSGETLPQIMRRGGWKSPAIVMRYTEQTDLQPME